MNKAVVNQQPEDGRQYKYTSKFRNEPPKQTNRTQIYYGKKAPREGSSLYRGTRKIDTKGVNSLRYPIMHTLHHREERCELRLPW